MTAADPSASPAGSFSLPWPLPALGAWSLAWALCLGAAPWIGPGPAFVLAALAGLALGWKARRPMRRWVVALGFPLSASAAGLAGALPAWAWLLPLALLVAIYPLRAWRDAPLFPTPPHALDELARHLRLAPGARVLDAGSGAGDGLRALRNAWPQARIAGVEWSWPLVAWSALRCRFADVRRGDMWAAPWQGQDLVYLFQRPESMARAWAKAQAEMAPGRWLVSLEFVVPGQAADIEVALAGGRSVRAWRIGPQPGAARADNPR